jgi:hypothetical protein
MVPPVIQRTGSLLGGTAAIVLALSGCSGGSTPDAAPSAAATAASTTPVSTPAVATGPTVAASPVPPSARTCDLTSSGIRSKVRDPHIAIVTVSQECSLVSIGTTLSDAQVATATKICTTVKQLPGVGQDVAVSVTGKSHRTLVGAHQGSGDCFGVS